MNIIFLMSTFLGEAEAKKKKKGEGVNIVITVLDEQSKKPVSTAKVKHPLEEIAHSVNDVTGVWQDTRILLPDGDMLHFSPGSSVDFQVSAPGYVTKYINYDIQPWKNKVDIYLKKMDLNTGDDLLPLPLGGDENRDPSMGGGGN